MQERTGGSVAKPRSKSKSLAKYAPPVPAVAGGTGRITGRMPVPILKITYSSARICGQTLLFVFMLTLAAFGALYAALSSGPISMTFLVPPIERAVNAGMGGFRFDIGDAVLRKSESGYGIEFRLADVSVMGEDGDRIVDAPLASADVSMSALMRGQLAPREVDLIGPRLFLHYSEDKGLSLSSGDPRAADAGPSGAPMAGNGQGGQSTPQESSRAAAGQSGDALAGAQGAAPPAPPLNLTKLLRDMFVAMRRGETAYLTNFAISDAVVFFDRGDSINRWDVPRLAIDFAHESRTRELLGDVTIRSGAESWQMKFSAGENPGNGAVDLSVSINDFHPHLLAPEFPNVKLLKIWDMPVSVAAMVSLSAEGDIQSADLRASLQSGLLYAPWDDKHPAAIDQGNFRLTYSRAQELFEIKPSDIRWGQSRIRFGGGARRDQATGRWDYQVLASDVVLGAEEFGVPAIPIDRLMTQGSYDPRDKAFEIARLYVQAADASINISGSVRQGERSPSVRIDGTLSSMPVAFFKLVWPKFILAGAREWIGTHIPNGRIASGRVRIDIPDGMLANVPEGGDIPPEALDLKLEMDNLVVRYWAELPVMQAAKSVASVSGRKFSFTVPEAAVTLPSGNRVQLNSGEFIIGDLRPKVQQAEIHFKTQSDAKAAFEFLEHPPLGYMSRLKMKVPDVHAPLATTFSMSLPLLREVKYSDLKMNGRARLQDVKATDLPGGFVIQGGTLEFDISESAMEGRGDVKMSGMPTKINWQRLFDAPADRQPPLRVRAIIDDAAREEMGAQVNHVLRGPVAAELTVNQRKDAPPLIRFEANLSDADVIVASMGWRKPPGQRALLTTEIETGDKGAVSLRNLNVSGDDLAVRGEINLDDKRRPVSFRLPTLQLNLQTQMELSGELTPANVWKVRATGNSYDGRQFFRSLFSAGQIAENQPELPQNSPGLDFKADVETVIGHFDTTLRKVSIEARRRNNRLVFLDTRGRLNGRDPVTVRIDTKGGDARNLIADTSDGGAAFRLVGFYQSARGGEVSLRVNLDGATPGEKTGILFARNFAIVGDQVVGEVLSGQSGGGDNPRPVKARQPQVGQGQLLQFNQVDFERMRVPFSVGNGQFVVRDGLINGPLLGATMRGSIDFKRERINVTGTYVPLFGLNGAIGAIPIFGQLLTSRDGEGLFGVTFAVRGTTQSPEVLVNPMSVVAPGFLRQLFEFDQDAPQTAPDEKRAPEKSGANVRASSVPPVTR